MLKSNQKIQRADDLIEFEDACTALDLFCKRRKQKVFNFISYSFK